MKGWKGGGLKKSLVLITFDDRKGGIGEKITDYVNRGRGLQKADMFPLKRGLYHQFLESKTYVLMYLYISHILLII